MPGCHGALNDTGPSIAIELKPLIALGFVEVMPDAADAVVIAASRQSVLRRPFDRVGHKFLGDDRIASGKPAIERECH